MFFTQIPLVFSHTHAAPDTRGVFFPGVLLIIKVPAQRTRLRRRIHFSFTLAWQLKMFFETEQQLTLHLSGVHCDFLLAALERHVSVQHVQCHVVQVQKVSPEKHTRHKTAFSPVFPMRTYWFFCATNFETIAPNI